MLCFATVGSTRFDALISALCSEQCADVLHHLGFTSLLLQIGSSKLETIPESLGPLKLEHYRYKDDITADIAEADLVIGHAGAGTCLQVLDAQKPLIVVINEQLMDNHQHELADQLAALGHVVSCTPGQLVEVLSTFDAKNLKPFTVPNYRAVAKKIDALLGL